MFYIKVVESFVVTRIKVKVTVDFQKIIKCNALSLTHDLEKVLQQTTFKLYRKTFVYESRVSVLPVFRCYAISVSNKNFQISI